MELGIASVAAITAIAYLVGMVVKTTGARLAQHCRCWHRVRLGRVWRAPEREAADKTGAAAPIRRGGARIGMLLHVRTCVMIGPSNGFGEVTNARGRI